jgi:hypothetical protein
MALLLLHSSQRQALLLPFLLLHRQPPNLRSLWL